MQKSRLLEYIEENVVFLEECTNTWNIRATENDFETPDITDTNVDSSYFYNSDNGEEYTSWEEVIERCTKIINDRQQELTNQ